MELPNTIERVTKNTSEDANRAIQERTARSIQYYRLHPNEISQRLRELDREWDIERALEANASTLVVLGTTLGLTVNHRFFAVPLVVGGFLLQHALQGWCPPLPLMRRLGYRTVSEIKEERDALESLNHPLVYPGQH